ncbi:uncharacterized protein LOC133896945 [Phragmites australis]|uniref:uncharacterized protein LOC133896945 n=1 Tax=Phragmites australis TaxID=29695 RepID=UPI002D76B1B4|nr:uncharacterized protein LOC133896945 [Phragmites australis]
MVNLVGIAKKQLVHRPVKRAGLRPHAVDVDDAGTVVIVWVPKDKLPAADEGGGEEEEAESKSETAGSRLLLVCNSITHCSSWLEHWRSTDVYVPDLLYFGGSTSPAPGRSPGFQAECAAAALQRLGVERCAAVLQLLRVRGVQDGRGDPGLPPECFLVDRVRTHVNA